jgi:hypothetical protein
MFTRCSRNSSVGSPNIFRGGAVLPSGAGKGPRRLGRDDGVSDEYFVVLPDLIMAVRHIRPLLDDVRPPQPIF